MFYVCDPGVFSYREKPIEGFVADYANLIRALIDLYEAGFDPRWLEWAEKLQQKQDELFWDDEGSAYFSCSGADLSILIRLKDGKPSTSFIQWKKYDNKAYCRCTQVSSS